MLLSYHPKNLIYAGTGFQKFLRLGVLVSVGFLILGLSLFLYRVQPFTKKYALEQVSTSPNKVDGFVSTAGTSTVRSNLIFSEINIANDGLAFIKNAKIQNISGDKIQTVMVWRNIQFRWTVKIDNVTKFFDQQGRKTDSSALKVGNALNVTGKVIDSKDGDTFISAEFIRIISDS